MQGDHITNKTNGNYKIIQPLFLIIGIVVVDKKIFLNDKKSVLNFSVGVFTSIAILSCYKLKDNKLKG